VGGARLLADTTYRQTDRQTDTNEGV